MATLKAFPQDIVNVIVFPSFRDAILRLVDALSGVGTARMMGRRNIPNAAFFSVWLGTHTKASYAALHCLRSALLPDHSLLYSSTFQIPVQTALLVLVLKL